MKKKQQPMRCKGVPVLEMSVGVNDGAGGMPRGLRVAWARFAKAELPLGGIRILIARGSGRSRRARKDGILDALADAQHMIENYFKPLFEKPEIVSELVLRSRIKDMEERKKAAVVDADPNSWPKDRYRKAEELTEKVAVLFFLKNASPAQRESYTRFWLQKKPNMLQDVMTWQDSFLNELNTPSTESAA